LSRLLKLDLVSILAAVGFFGGAVALYAWTHGSSGFDDTYITYVFARSLAEGRGLTWPGSNALGTSSPFLAVVLAALHIASGISIPDLGELIGWLALATTGFAFVQLGRADGWALAGAYAGAIWMSSWFASLNLGNEYLPAIAAVVLAFWALKRERFVVAGLVLALAALFRAECGLAAPAVASVHLLRRPDRRGLLEVSRMAASAAVVALLWVGALIVFTGRVVPGTLAAKRAQAESVLGLWKGGPALRATLAHPESVFPAPFRPCYPVLGIAALVSLASWRRRSGFPAALLLWGVAHLGLVALLGLPGYQWYSLPMNFACCLLAALAVRPPPFPAFKARVVWGAVVGVSLTVVVSLSVKDRLSAHGYAGDPRRISYGEVARLADRYPPTTTIGAWEVGFLGWSSSRPVVDLFGLVSEDVDLDAVRRGRLDFNLKRLHPGLLMMTPGSRELWLSTIGEPREFVNQYRLDAAGLSLRRPVVVYRRSDLTARASVDVDLLSESPRDATIEYRQFGDRGFLCLVLQAGSAVEWSLAPGRGQTLFAELASELGNARIEVRMRPNSQRVWKQRLTTAGWSHWERLLPERAERGELQVRCAGEHGRVCLVGLPYVGRAGPLTRHHS